MTLEELNAASPAAFAAALDGVFEHAPWVAQRAAAARPFPTVTALHLALFAVVEVAPADQQRAFLAGHPDLAGTLARQRGMAAFSTDEQAGLGLDRLDDAGFERFEAMNAAYRDRFGIPFILCVRRHTRASVLDRYARRLRSDADTEIATALAEVFLITRLRIVGLVDGPGMPVVAGRLSNHVLNTALGRPAEGVLLELFGLDGNDAIPLAQTTTDADGRGRAPLLPPGPLRMGRYELRFHVGPYFKALGLPLADPPFFDVIPVRFGIAEPEAHYHVPLLVSPWTYTTYRGS